MKLSKTRTALGFCSVVAVAGVMFAHFGDQLKISEEAALIIGNAEGCRRNPYHCPADVLTVGIGSTEASGGKIDPKKRYSDEEIADRWAKDLILAQNCVDKFGNGNQMPQGVYDASVSMTFNVGCGAMRKSTLFRKAQQNDWLGVCNELPKWVYAGGKKLNGLVKRREQERALCLDSLKVR